MAAAEGHRNLDTFYNGDIITEAHPPPCYIIFILFWRFGMELKIKKGRRAFVDTDCCVACGCCKKVCPTGAIEIWRGVAAQVDLEKCVGCGKCTKECPASVIVLQEAAI